MVYWGSPKVGTWQEVSKDYECNVGQIICHKSDGFAWAWESAQTILDDIVNRITGEGHQPIYAKVEVTGNYLIGYTYSTEVQLKVLHTSPLPIAWIIVGVLVLLALIVVYFTVEKFLVFLKESPILGLGLLAVLAIFGLVFLGVRLPKKEGEEKAPETEGGV